MPGGVGAPALSEEVLRNDLPYRFEDRCSRLIAAWNRWHSHAEDVTGEQKRETDLPCRAGSHGQLLHGLPIGFLPRQRRDLGQQLEAMPEMFGGVTAGKHDEVGVTERRETMSVDDHRLVALPRSSELKAQWKLY